MQTVLSDFTSSPASSVVEEPNPRPRERVPLWRLHGATDDLVCAAIVTSYGYALSLELGGEPILLELQRSLELLTSKASRLETGLLTQGWEIAAD